MAKPVRQNTISIQMAEGDSSIDQSSEDNSDLTSSDEEESSSSEENEDLETYKALMAHLSELRLKLSKEDVAKAEA